MELGESRQRWPDQRGASNHGARLTRDQVVAIRCQRSQGDTYQCIATMFGVAASTVYRICSRKGLAHV